MPYFTRHQSSLLKLASYASESLGLTHAYISPLIDLPQTICSQLLFCSSRCLPTSNSSCSIFFQICTQNTGAKATSGSDPLSQRLLRCFGFIACVCRLLALSDLLQRFSNDIHSSLHIIFRNIEGWNQSQGVIDRCRQNQHVFLHALGLDFGSITVTWLELQCQHQTCNSKGTTVSCVSNIGLPPFRYIPRPLTSWIM